MEQKELYQREISICTKGRNVVDNNLELQCDNWDTDVDKYEENKHTKDIECAEKFSIIEEGTSEMEMN